VRQRSRVFRRSASGVSAVVLAAGLVVSSIATAAPAGASESMKVELHKLRICESGDNYHLNTGNGYYGAYQFAAATWHALGYRGRPDHAKALTQNRAARKLHSLEGWRAWPSCARAEHLR
jgi:resuscitation-promoting factor RpfA